ncbi:hypothetical protein [Flocculibacter collagenilyticus]|uniref:hypothetical protein n=1 Tax=Flocculibacter collagenilyticus TaxID=2744479 RepID=UPI0018F5ECD8|nr:hypothetical protein [Flocculibacter collagenilyticus]
MKKYFIVFIMLFTLPAVADFNIKGSGEITFPTGTTKPIDFGFAFNKSKGKFKVGKNEFSTSQVPAKYSIGLILHKSEHIWVQEFNKGYFSTFKWTLGKHKIELYKTPKGIAKMGNYALKLDDQKFFLTNKIAQINFQFSDDGIKKITVDGMAADIGLNN